MQKRALLAIFLTVPVPSLGVLSAMYWWPDSLTGTVLFSLAKVWLLALPLLWHRFVDREPLSWSPPRKGGFRLGLLSGAGMSLAILLAYLLFVPRLVDTGGMRAQVAAIGLDTPSLYLGTALYWILVNSVLEEYVWRWFVFRKSAVLTNERTGVILSALFFTLHHYLALSLYLSPLPAFLCALGVFLGGLVWSLLYARYASIWPAYLSHAIVDVAVFGIGGWMLFAS